MILVNKESKGWVQLNITSCPLASYTQLKEIFLLTFQAQNMKWRNELYDKGQEAKEGSLNLIMKKLELIEKLKFGLCNCENVELILVCILPYIQEKLELRNLETFSNLMEEVNRINNPE